jgi:hypothetical protein
MFWCTTKKLEDAGEIWFYTYVLKHGVS